MRRSTSPATSHRTSAFLSPRGLARGASAASLGSLLLLVGLGATACEDGPAQPFSPAPAGAASTWNNSHGSEVDPATKNFSSLQGGTNANVLCNGPTLASTWATMDSQPIVPPLGGAGIDMAGPGCTLSGAGVCNWQGLTIEQAEQTLCQSSNQGDVFGQSGELTNCWGDSNEVCAQYAVSTHKINFMSFWPGYLGALKAQGCAGTISNGYNYSFPLYTQVQRNGKPWEIDWTAPIGPNDWRNEATSAILCTYAPGLAVDPDCNASGACIQGSFGAVAYLYIPAVGFAIWTQNQFAAQPTPSILIREDVYLSKVTPYAGAASLLKIDAVGPTATSGVLNAQTKKPCTLQFGLTFSDFLSECVEVSSTPATNQGEYNKLVGGISHDAQTWTFDVQGVDVNFSDGSLGPTDVVQDFVTGTMTPTVPGSNDTVFDFSLDQSTLGPIVQDYKGNDPKQEKDLHGYGLVYLQFARRAQADLNAALAPSNPAFAHYIGDLSCAGDPPKSTPLAGCTGLETFITTVPQALVTMTTTLPGAVPQTLTAKEMAFLPTAALPAGLDVMSTTAPNVFAQMRIGLKPGHQKTAFCDDHSLTGLTNCDEKWLGDTFPNSFARVVQVVANNSAVKMPVDAQDDRFFFKEWVYAFLQYLKAEGAAVAAGQDPSAITLADVDAQTFDTYNLFFDSSGDGQFESAEYVERAFVTNSVPPMDFRMGADIKNGIFNDYDFSRYLYRGETTMYQAMQDGRKGAVPLGSQDNALLTNMFGSVLLRTAWTDHTTGAGNSAYTAYYCATNKDPTHCGNDLPPLNPDGTLLLNEEGAPILQPYEGAFGTNATAFTLGQGESPSGPVPVNLVKGQGTSPTKDGTFPDIQEAFVSVPLHVNPYDPTSAPPPQGNPAVQVLVPWAPKQPGIGFPVALDGMRDRFIQTYQLDFSGIQISANIDYDFVLDTNGSGTPASPPRLLFLAVETTDFLGDIFVCRDTTTKDLLSVRMYTSVATVLDWLAAHPTAYADCNIIVRYSPYENYVDDITSLSNGVRLGATQGGGYGRIVDGLLFDPTLPDN